MAHFTYHGPVQSIALAVGRTKDENGNEISEFKDVDFIPGQQTPDLPEDNPLIQTMIDARLLEPASTAAAAKSKPARSAAQKAEK